MLALVVDQKPLGRDVQPLDAAEALAEVGRQVPVGAHGDALQGAVRGGVAPRRRDLADQRERLEAVPRPARAAVSESPRLRHERGVLLDGKTFVVDVVRRPPVPALEEETEDQSQDVRRRVMVQPGGARGWQRRVVDGEAQRTSVGRRRAAARALGARVGLEVRLERPGGGARAVPVRPVPDSRLALRLGGDPVFAVERVEMEFDLDSMCDVMIQSLRQ